jgi:glycosyltransferase involved in cell wall biosynthesis
MLISSYYPKVDRAAIQLSGLLDRIDRDRFAPFVLTRHLPGTGCVDMSGNTPVIRVSAPVKPNAFFFTSLRYLWRHRKDYDVIDVHSFDSAALAGAVIKRLTRGKRLILRVPGLGGMTLRDRRAGTDRGRSRIRFILDSADAVIPTCPEATVALKASGVARAKIAPIPGGVETERFSPAGVEEKRVLKRSFGISEEAFVGIVVARLVPREYVMNALEAWKRASHTHPRSVLVVTGSGPEGPRLSAYAAERLAGRSVIFTGGATRDEISRLLKTADVYVSYARSEGTSNATLEAMSSGLPVVAAETPGNKEVVNHAKTGFLFDADHPMDGADYILRLGEDPALLADMSREARRAAESRLSFEWVARRVEDLYLGARVPGPERTSAAQTELVVAAVEQPQCAPAAGPWDASPLNATPPDAAPWDAEPCDASPPDATLRDASPLNATPPDAAPWDAEPCDASPPDATLRDASPPPSGSTAKRRRSKRRRRKKKKRNRARR